MFSSKLKNVLVRECGIWLKRPIYIIAPILIMTFCSIFYLTFLGDGLPSGIPTAVVDYDNSSVSRNLIRQIHSTQTSDVKLYGDFHSARMDMQSGHVSSVLVIPKDFCESLQASRQPRITIYINGLYFVGGALSYQSLLTIVNLVSGAVQKQILEAKGVPPQEITGMLRPVNIEVHKIGNPLTSYNACLSTKLLPGTLQLIIILLVIYSLGTELKYGKSLDLMNAAGGSIFAAVGGKLILFTGFFTILGLLLDILLYVVMRFPMDGSIWYMMLDMFLLIIASEAAGVAIVSLIPICRFALSIGSIYSVLSFSFAGFTLPVEVMPWMIQSFACIFPLRHYFLFETQEAVFGSGFAGWWPEMLWMLSFLILPILLLPRLKSAFIKRDYPKN